MTQILLDDVLRAKLHGLTAPLEICNAEGRVVARVLPVLSGSEYDNLEPPISKEELQRRRSKTAGRTHSTVEVLAHLKQLENQ